MAARARPDRDWVVAPQSQEPTARHDQRQLYRLAHGRTMTSSLISLLAVRYREKAAWARKRASLTSGELTKEALLQTAATYERMARAAEEMEKARGPVDHSRKGRAGA